MSQERLRELMDELHRELESSGKLDDEGQQMVETLRRDLDGVLARPDAASQPADASLVERLKEATGRFEESHPRLSLTIAQLSDVLGAMGL